MKLRPNVIELKIPLITEEEAVLTVKNWLVNVGEKIEIDQDLMELTVNDQPFMLPSPIDGKLISIEVEPGEPVEPGQVIATIETD